MVYERIHILQSLLMPEGEMTSFTVCDAYRYLRVRHC